MKPTSDVPAILNSRLALRRTADGSVEVLLTGQTPGGDRWEVAATATALEWVQGIAGVSALADGDTRQFVIALNTAAHLHIGRHFP